MNMWLSRYTVVDAINLWLQQSDQKVSIDGKTVNGCELVAQDMDMISGDIKVVVEDKQLLAILRAPINWEKQST